MADVFNPKVILLIIIFADLVSSMPFPRNKRRKKLHLNSSQRPLLKVNNFSRTNLQLSHATNRRCVTIYSPTNRLFIVVNKNQKPNGSSQLSSRANFQIQSVATSIVRLKNIETGSYLAINPRGRLKLQRHPDDNSLFKEVAEENFFHSFASHKYYNKEKHDVFLGVKTNGEMKSPRTTAPGQRAVMFLYFPIEQNYLTKRTKHMCNMA